MRVQEARDYLMESLRRIAGHDVTAAEAMTMLGPKGRRVIALAEAEQKAVKKAAKKAVKKAAEESVLRTLITESLTAAQAPAAPSGAALAPQAGGDGLLALGAGNQSPFWRSPAATAETVSAPESSRPLHEMDPEEFRAHAADTIGTYGRAAGHSSPIWQ